MKYCIRNILENDVSTNNGKQIEFSKNIASDFFEINPNDNSAKFDFVFFPLEANHSNSSSVRFDKVELKKSEHRGDYKIYGNDNFQIKKFFRDDLKVKAKSSKVLLFKNDKDSIVYFSILNQGNKLLDLFNIKANETKTIEKVNTQTETISLPRNRIIFGAPGTGKSYKLKQEAQLFSSDCVERVTFHPSYSYSQFVGTYKPLQEEKEGGKIRYEYVPGPFMRMFTRAIQDTDNNYLLLIEEINRANVSAVFGDIFQLLDRDEKGNSEYKIATSEDVKRFLKEQGFENDEYISIPSNMYIWATMNSADQGVMPIDAAFKRRWSFEYVNIDNAEDKLNNYRIPPTINEKDDKKLIEWNTFRKKLNDKLSDLGVNEDKLIGPFFLDSDSIKNNNNIIDYKMIENKLIMYLFEDVVKMHPGDLFNFNGIKPRYSDLCKKLEQEGLQSIFMFEI